MVVDGEINKIGEEINIDEIECILVNNVILKHDEFGESSRRKTYFISPAYVLAGCTSSSLQGKSYPVKTLALPQLAKQALS